MHGGKSPGAPKGNTNAFKHGRYAVEAIAARREIAALLRAMRTLVDGAIAAHRRNLPTLPVLDIRHPGSETTGRPFGVVLGCRTPRDGFVRQY
jgi:hypothetical protein